MAFDGATTYADVRAQYLANCGYETVASARLFAEACRALLVWPRRTGSGGDGPSDEWDLEQIKGELRTAQAYIDNAAGPAAGGPGVLHMRGAEDWR